MPKEYVFWYSETYTRKAWFTADTPEEAVAMLESVQESETEIEELPNFGQKDKSYELDIDIWSMEAVE